jgi:hypothetical protein
MNRERARTTARYLKECHDAVAASPQVRSASAPRRDDMAAQMPYRGEPIASDAGERRHAEGVSPFPTK